MGAIGRIQSLEQANERLEAAEARLEELVAVVAQLQPADELARVQSIAEDGLARASNAQAIAEDALARAAEATGRGEDALARADNAQSIADDAHKRLAEVEGRDVDALARADNAQSIAEGALARATEAVGRGADALARAGNAQSAADEAHERLAELEGHDADALTRASNAQAIAQDALDQATEARSSGGDALARAGNAQTAADDAHERLAELESRDADALTRAGNAQAIAEDALAQAAAAKAGSEDALARADGVGGLADDALQRAAAAQARADDAAAAAAVALDAAREALLPARMAAFEAWLRLCPPDEELKISVVLPSRDRPALLPRALESVRAQAHGRWELLVVDDGDTDAVAKALADVEDERVVVVDGPRRGPGAARNAGLTAASGDVVCYLDDDNVMHPRWLQAVARVFTTREDVDVSYGVTVAEHRIPGKLEPPAWWPSFWQLEWSREKLLEENLTDTGALAHRRDLPEARFDEALGDDWDLLIRLTADKPALAIPAVSHAYAMAGEGHVSRTPEHQAGLDAVRRRHAEGA